MTKECYMRLDLVSNQCNDPVENKGFFSLPPQTVPDYINNFKYWKNNGFSQGIGEFCEIFSSR